jgi:hypothetical protein
MLASGQMVLESSDPSQPNKTPSEEDIQEFIQSGIEALSSYCLFYEIMRFHVFARGLFSKASFRSFSLLKISLFNIVEIEFVKIEVQKQHPVIDIDSGNVCTWREKYRRGISETRISKEYWES